MTTGGVPGGSGVQGVQQQGGEPAAPPSQDERLFGVLAYLSALAGFWLIGPVLVYALRRRSAFARFHAGQALAAHIAVGAGTGIAGILFVVSMYVLFLVAEFGDIRSAGLWVEMIPEIGGALLTLPPAAALVLCAIPAFNGKCRPLPLVGRFAPRIQEPAFRLVDSLAESAGPKAGPPPPR